MLSIKLPEVEAGKVIKGFEDALLGMKEGEEKEFKVPPSRGYKEFNPKLVEKIRKGSKESILKPGIEIMVKLKTGKMAPATVLKVTNDSVLLDLNHPLAGKTLEFKIKVVEISS